MVAISLSSLKSKTSRRRQLRNVKRRMTALVKEGYGRLKGFGIDARVKKAIRRREETKYVANQIATSVSVSQQAIVPTNLYRILPTLNQGVKENQRVGDKIEPVRASTYFTFNFEPNSAICLDMVVNLYILTAKGAFNGPAVNSLPNGCLLKTGAGTNVDPTGYAQNVMLAEVNHYPINTDAFTVQKHYCFRMRKGIGALNSNTGVEIYPTGSITSEGSRTIKYTWTPPQLKYNEDTSTLPQNHYPVAVCWYTNADGNGGSSTNLFASIRSEMYYKDM